MRASFFRVASVLSFVSLVSGGLVLGACGGKVVFDDGSGGANFGVGPDASATAATGTTVNASSSTGVVDDLTITVDSAGLAGGCMPFIPPDPLGGAIDVSYHNGSSKNLSVEVVSVSLLLSLDGANLSWSFDVDPPGSGNVGPGETVHVQHRKIGGSGVGDPSDHLCNFCGGSGEVKIDWSNGHSDTFPISSLPCTR